MRGMLVNEVKPIRPFSHDVHLLNLAHDSHQWQFGGSQFSQWLTVTLSRFRGRQRQGSLNLKTKLIVC
jgi:hypothetical protein